MHLLTKNNRVIGDTSCDCRYQLSVCPPSPLYFLLLLTYSLSCLIIHYPFFLSFLSLSLLSTPVFLILFCQLDSLCHERRSFLCFVFGMASNRCLIIILSERE